MIFVIFRRNGKFYIAGYFPIYFFYKYPMIINKLSTVFKVLVLKQKYYYLSILNTDLDWQVK